MIDISYKHQNQPGIKNQQYFGGGFGIFQMHVGIYKCILKYSFVKEYMDIKF